MTIEKRESWAVRVEKLERACAKARYEGIMEAASALYNRFGPFPQGRRFARRGGEARAYDEVMAAARVALGVKS